MKILEIREVTLPISSSIRNAYIDFSKMTLSLVAVMTDVIRDGKPVVGYGFNSNGRRSEEHTSELQSLMRISYAVFCLKKKKKCTHHMKKQTRYSIQK